MKTRAWLLGAVLACACGPPIPGPQPPPPRQPDSCDGGCNTPVTPAESLWPMTQGSHWRYRIDDPLRGQFEKVVTVSGPAKVPGTDRDSVLFISVQPYLEERSYELEGSGLVKRAYEYDYRSGILARETTWAPETIKSIAAAQPLGYQAHEVVTETVKEAGTTAVHQKEYTWQVVEVDVPMTVAGKEVKAVKIHRSRDDKTGKDKTYWLVPGIGKVHEEGERTEDLIEYEVK